MGFAASTKAWLAFAVRDRASSRGFSMSKLHLVFGGRVKDPQTLDFADLSTIDIVGVFPDYKSAEDAWRAAAQRTVDDAEMRYVVVHLHRLLEPDMLKPAQG
jgi:hypothetical protein